MEEGLSPPLAGGGRGWGTLIGLISWISLIGLISTNQVQNDVTISPPLRGRLGGEWGMIDRFDKCIKDYWFIIICVDIYTLPL